MEDQRIEIIKQYFTVQVDNLNTKPQESINVLSKFFIPANAEIINFSRPKLVHRESSSFGQVVYGSDYCVPI